MLIPREHGYIALMTSGHPQSVEDNILNEKMKNSLMGTQGGGCRNGTEGIDSREKVSDSDERPRGLKTVSEICRKYPLASPLTIGSMQKDDAGVLTTGIFPHYI